MNTGSQLKVSLDDLLNAREKGLLIVYKIVHRFFLCLVLLFNLSFFKCRTLFSDQTIHSFLARLLSLLFKEKRLFRPKHRFYDIGQHSSPFLLYHYFVSFRHSTLLLFVFLNPGKWWVVGSAWAGRNPNDKKDNRAENEDDGLAQGGGDIANVSSALLEKAKKLRMNTDTRKNIFCIIMTCEVSFLLNSFLRFFFFEYA